VVGFVAEVGSSVLCFFFFFFLGKKKKDMKHFIGGSFRRGRKSIFWRKKRE